MKALTRSMVLVIVVALVLPIAIVQAEEGEEQIPSGYFIQNAESGTAVMNDDGTYTLTLEGVGDSTTLLLTSGDASVGQFNTGQLALGWSSAPEALEASALLEIGEDVVPLVLSAPDYDAEADVLTYVAVPVEGDKDVPELPAAFDAASLFITGDEGFMVGLRDGFANAGVRATLQCIVFMTPAGHVWSQCYWVP